FTDSQRQKLLLQGKLNVWLLYEYNNYQDVTQVQLNDIQNYLPGDILVKTDLASMMSGLEVRVPYLDHRLVPLALSLPESEKLDMFQGKKLLKQIAREHIPAEIVNRAKRGFTVPLSNWFEQSQLLQEYLLGETYYLHQWVDRRYVKQLWDQHNSKHRDNS